MKKTLKKAALFSSCLWILLPALNFGGPIYANELSKDQDKVVQVTTDSNPLAVNLEMKVGKTVVKEFVLPSGEKGRLEVTKIALPPLEPDTGFRSIRWHSEQANNGTYYVNAYVGLGYACFNIDVKSKNITSAYDGQYFFAGADASGNLSHESSKQATYYLDFSVPTPWVTAASWNGFVRAKIEGSNLVTYIQ